MSDDFQSYRPLLFSIAYRMTGSASEAEDIVQDSYLRYHAAEPGEIRSVKSYLSTIVTRLSLDHLKSARVEREQYIGTWLPEPILTGNSALAAHQSVEQYESIATAFLLLLEALSPHERVVFLLREVFEYEHAEIAQMLGLSAANCRQLFHRALAREVQQRLIERFFARLPAGRYCRAHRNAGRGCGCVVGWRWQGQRRTPAARSMSKARAGCSKRPTPPK